ncbi:MAG: hypothetical protein AB7E52_04595 [Bdellovibrionales bacterium]
MSNNLTIHHAGPEIINDPSRWAPLPEVEPQAFQTSSQKLVYLGGIYNLMGLYQGLRIGNTLQEINADHPENPVDYFSLTLFGQKEIKDFLEEETFVRNTYNEYGKLRPTSYVNRLIHKVLLPHDLLTQWKACSNPTPAMFDYFSRINLLGFSYGHRIIQQLDVGMQACLEKEHLPVFPLRALKAVTLAAATLPVANGQIHQLLFTRSSDSYVEKPLSQALFSNGTQKYPAIRDGNSVCIGEKCDDDVIHSVCVKNVNAERTLPEFFSETQKDGHTFWLYTNPPVLEKDDKIYVTNSCLGALFRTALREMLTSPRGSDFRFQNVPVLARLLDPETNKQTAQSLQKWRWLKLRHYQTLQDQYKKLWPDTVAQKENLTRDLARLTAASSPSFL